MSLGGVGGCGGERACRRFFRRSLSCCGVRSEGVWVFEKAEVCDRRPKLFRALFVPVATGAGAQVLRAVWFLPSTGYIVCLGTHLQNVSVIYSSTTRKFSLVGRTPRVSGPLRRHGLARRQGKSCGILLPLSSFFPRHATRQVILCASCCLDLNLFKSQSICRRYITKNLQKEFGFHGMQVRLTLKKSVNVYDPEGRGGSGKGRAKRKTGKRGRLLPQPPSPTRYRPGSHK